MRENLYDSIAETLSKKGINCVVGSIYDMIEIWKSWYRGNVNDFHYYTQTLVNGTTCEMERLTMNMPKKVCEDLQKLTWSEKVQITLDSEEKTKRLWEILDSKKNSFTVNFPKTLEKMYALGTSALVEYIKDNEILIDYIDADMIIPYKFTNSYINGIITISISIEKKGKNRVYYTLLTFHEYDGKDYIKYHELYESKIATRLGKEINLTVKYPNLEESIIYENVKTPHFQILRPNITNNFDLDSPLGISVLANNIDKFKAIDTKYDSFNNEFELGKKMVLVDRTAVKGAKEVDNEGNVRDVSHFDKNNKVFVAINGMEQQPVKEIDMTLRVDEHVSGINADLKYLSAGIGLEGFYEFDSKGIKTATEVISENSEAFRTKKNHETIIKDVVYDLVQAICQLANIETKTINVVTDDSIIEDENTLIERGLKLYNANVISLETFMIKYLHYDESQVETEKTKILSNIKVVTELLNAEIIDHQKAIELLFEGINEDEKNRLIANSGNIAIPEEDEADE